MLKKMNGNVKNVLNHEWKSMGQNDPMCSLKVNHKLKFMKAYTSN